MDEYFVSSAQLLQNTDFDDVCRTQVRLHLDESCDYFFQNPLGNHHVLIRGNHAQALSRFFELNQAHRIS